MICLLCGKNKFTQVSNKIRNNSNLRVHRCNYCKLTQLSPLPSEKNIKSLYDLPIISISKEQRRELKNKEFFSLIDTIPNADLVGSLVKKGALILDYGCGYGFFVREMKDRGYNVAGIDLSPIRIDTAKSICRGIPLFNNENELPQTQFDCVTIFHVLEHVRHPVNFLISLKKYVKKNGFVILEVPNLNDHLVDMIPEYRDFYWKREHLSYFDEKTLRKCISKAELKIEKIQYVQRWNIYNLMNWLMRKGPQPKNEVIKYLRDNKLPWLDEYYKKYLINNKRADAIVIVCKIK